MASLKRILFALVNLFGFAGVGTILSGRIKTGIAQIALNIFGLALLLVPFFLMLGELGRQGAHLDGIMLVGPDGEAPDYSSSQIGYLLASLSGAVIVIGNIIWSVFTTGPKIQPPPLLPRKQ